MQLATGSGFYCVLFAFRLVLVIVVCLLYALHATLVNDTRCLVVAAAAAAAACNIILRQALKSLYFAQFMQCAVKRSPALFLLLSLSLPTVRSSSFSFIRFFSFIRSFPFSFRVLNTRKSIQFSLVPLDSHRSSLRNCQKKFQLRSFIAPRVMAANHF